MKYKVDNYCPDHPLFRWLPLDFHLDRGRRSEYRIYWSFTASGINHRSYTLDSEFSSSCIGKSQPKNMHISFNMKSPWLIWIVTRKNIANINWASIWKRKLLKQIPPWLHIFRRNLKTNSIVLLYPNKIFSILCSC